MSQSNTRVGDFRVLAGEDLTANTIPGSYE
jgi:hypothetical protein